MPASAMHAREGRAARYTLRSIALVYLLLVLVAPLSLVFWNTFADGLSPVWEAINNRSFTHALYLSAIIALIAVPLNTVFGVATALMLVRSKVPGRRVIGNIVDLPLALSPVVVGLALLLVWRQDTPRGRDDGWLGGFLSGTGFEVTYALPGMVLATVFICLPFVVREVVPVLREIGHEQEEAASTLGATPMQTFWRVTLPAIRWGLVYGVVLTTARALGEYGAVAVMSGAVAGKTETLTLHVDQQFEGFQYVDAYTSSLALALMALTAVVLMNVLTRRGGSAGGNLGA